MELPMSELDQNIFGLAYAEKKQEEKKILFAPEPQDKADVVCRDNQGGEYRVHSQIIQVNMAALRIDFESDVLIFDYSTLVVTCVFHYLYNYELDILSGSALEVWKFFVQYQIKVSSVFYQTLKQFLRKGYLNAILFCNLAHQFKCDKLLSVGLDYLRESHKGIAFTKEEMDNLDSNLHLQLMNTMHLPPKKQKFAFKYQEVWQEVTFIRNHPSDAKMLRILLKGDTEIFVDKNELLPLSQFRRFSDVCPTKAKRILYMK
jgi:hypothetical protein